MRPEMRNELATFAERPLRALRSGRFWLSSLVARLSPRHGAMMDAYRLEEEGRFDEALEIWKGLEARRRFGTVPLSLALRCGRLALRAGQYSESMKWFEDLLARHPGEPRVLRGLENAGLRGARDAQSRGHWLEACRMWGAYHRAGGDIDKCVRNLGDCARYVAQSADSVKKMGDALEAWGLLKIVDPYSQEAQQGMEWCRLSLARAAERSSDFGSARAHWSALLELSPDDHRALDGLRRLSAAGV
jgi:tetratricopeptide (TPR) repeat protein